MSARLGFFALAIVTAIAAGRAVSDEMSNKRILDVGRSNYELRCATCHGVRGEGAEGRLPALAPPLKNNAFVMNAPDFAIAEVIRKGRSGSRRSYDDTYPNMPAFDAEMVPDVAALIRFLKGDLQQSASDGE